MGRNERNRIPRDGRTSRQDSSRLEADYRREVRKAAEERVRRRLAAEERMYPLGQEATQSRYREDYRERNRSSVDSYARGRSSDKQPRYPRRDTERTRIQDSSTTYSSNSSSRSRNRQAAAQSERDDRMHERRQQRPHRDPDSRRADGRQRTSNQNHDARPSSRRDYVAREDRRERDVHPRNPQRPRQHGRVPREQEPIAQARDGMLSPRVIIAVAAVIAILIGATIVVRIATSLVPAETESILIPIEDQISTRVSAYLLPESEIVSKFENQGVDKEWAAKAAAMAQDDYRFMVMAHGSDIIGSDGAAVANKLVKLAVNDPEAVDYVYDYLKSYPQDSAQRCDDKIVKGVVPQLYQWDERWGYTIYSGCAFGCTGCGPTSLSMVYMGLTGKNDMSPADIAQLASEGGYETENNGTLNQFFIDAAPNLGLSVMELDIDSDALTAALEDDMPVVCNVGPGDFTANGHFFVITGLNDDGTVNINDPFSSVNSSETWDMDLILSQTYALYAYSLADDDTNDSEGEDTADESEDNQQVEESSNEAETWTYDDTYA